MEVAGDGYIEGSLRQIEAARLALHSPSLARTGVSCPAMRRPCDPPPGAAKPGRKCLSRTQMAEPYELSQDLLDKQMEVLSSRYGGIGQANDAANTIQRAYRRYNMVKKFAAITSAVQKNQEHRLSRRFQGQGGEGGAGGGGIGGQHRVRHVMGEEEGRRGGGEELRRGGGWDVTDSSGQVRGEGGTFHHASCCVFNSTSKSSYAGLAKVAGVAEEQSPALRQLPQHPHTPSHPPHHECHTPHCPSRGPWPLHTPHHHIGVRPGVTVEDENHSDAEIQSFPIDYLPDRSALACVARLPAGAPHRAIASGRAVGPSHAHCANCGSGQALPSHHSHRGLPRQQQQSRRAPDVPKRTVSRLTSLDVGESSELYPRPPEHRVTVSAPHSRNSSTHSSPRVPATAAHQPKLSLGSAAPQQPPSKPRVAQPAARKEPAAAYHSSYAVNEVIRKRHYRTGLNIFNKKPEKGVQYLIGEWDFNNS